MSDKEDHLEIMRSRITPEDYKLMIVSFDCAEQLLHTQGLKNIPQSRTMRINPLMLQDKPAFMSCVARLAVEAAELWWKETHQK